MKTLTREQAEALYAFLESFDLHTTGVWQTIETAMKDEWGIKDPEAAIEAAKAALQ